MRRILVVAAHPDDEVLGCGATVARFRDKGDDVVTLILGQGLMARVDDPTTPDRRALEAIKEEARQAAQTLGVADVRFGDLPDNRFDTVALLDVVKLVERTLADVLPVTVLTHHPGDLNVDHGLTFRAVLTACRPVEGQSVKTLWAFEVPSSTEWSSPALHRPFCPTVFVDATRTFERKVAALCAYRDEVRRPPHPRSPEMLEALARTRGMQSGRPLAEAFELIRHRVD